MVKSTPFLKTFFLPFACLLALMGIASTLSYKIGAHVREFMMVGGSDPASSNGWLYVISIAMFGAGLFYLRKINFKRIFKIGLIGVGALLLLSVIVRGTELAYFIAAICCPKILFLLSWAYVNQLTSQKEGAQYYFALGCVASLGIGLINFIPGLVSVSSSFYPALLLVTSLICLALAWVCNLWIHRKGRERVQPENTPSSFSNSSWKPIAMLALLLTGFQLLPNLNSTSFIAQMKTLFNSRSADYMTFMGIHSLVIGLGSLLFLIASLFVGPRLLSNKGWKFSLLVAPALGVVAVLALLISQKPFVHTFSQVIFKGVYYAWIFPLGSGQ